MTPSAHHRPLLLSSCLGTSPLPDLSVPARFLDPPSVYTACALVTRSSSPPKPFSSAIPLSRVVHTFVLPGLFPYPIFQSKNVSPIITTTQRTPHTTNPVPITSPIRTMTLTSTSPIRTMTLTSTRPILPSIPSLLRRCLLPCLALLFLAASDFLISFSMSFIVSVLSGPILLAITFGQTPIIHISPFFHSLFLISVVASPASSSVSYSPHLFTSIVPSCREIVPCTTNGPPIPMLSQLFPSLAFSDLLFLLSLLRFSSPS